MSHRAPIALTIVLSATSLGLGTSPSGARAATPVGTAGGALTCPSDRTDSGWYENNPTYLDARDDAADWTVGSPSSVGLDGARIDAGVDRWRQGPVQSVLVIRHGTLAYERYLNGGSARSANNLHSASKTLIGLLLGAAIAEGSIPSLDTTLAEVMPEYFGGPDDPRRAITLRHLATMSSGLRWKEDVSEYQIARRSTDWVRSVLDLGMVAAPGTTWRYSTGNTHLLSAAIARATGMSTCAFARSRLLDRMGITVEHWGVDPNGVNSGGYNVYLTAREMAKLGLLIANDGVWQGERLVPAAIVAGMRDRAFTVDKTYGYATTTWLRTIGGHELHFAWGWGGQMVYVIPDLDIVLVITERTTDGTGVHEVDSGRFIERYLLPAIAG